MKYLNLTLKIVIRIIGFPFVLCFILISSIYQIIVSLINYLTYGGEFIVYTKENNPKQILDVYKELVEKQTKIKEL